MKRKLGIQVLLETQDSYYKIFKVQDCQKNLEFDNSLKKKLNFKQKKEKCEHT